MKKLIERFKRFRVDVGLKLTVLGILLKGINKKSDLKGIVRQYKYLERIRKSKLPKDVKLIMFKGQLFDKNSYIKKTIYGDVHRQNDKLIDKWNNDWDRVSDRVKEIIDYTEELDKPYFENVNDGEPYLITAPLFYNPEVVNEHNETLDKNNGPDLIILKAKEKMASSYILRNQERKLNQDLKINSIKPTKIKEQPIPIKKDNLSYNENDEKDFNPALDEIKQLAARAKSRPSIGLKFEN